MGGMRSGRDEEEVATNLRPRQPRGPSENGCAASSWSVLFVPNQRSGRNESGESKCAEERLAATGLVETIVCSKRLSNSSSSFEVKESITYPSRQVVSIDRISPVRHDTGKRKRQRRIHAHSLKGHGMQIFQLRRGRSVNVLVGLEGGADFLLQALQDGRVP